MRVSVLRFVYTVSLNNGFTLLKHSLLVCKILKIWIETISRSKLFYSMLKSFAFWQIFRNCQKMISRTTSFWRFLFPNWMKSPLLKVNEFLPTRKMVCSFPFQSLNYESFKKAEHSFIELFLSRKNGAARLPERIGGSCSDWWKYGNLRSDWLW